MPVVDITNIMETEAPPGYHDRMTREETAQQWLRGAKRALVAAQNMMQAGDYEFSLFTCHLAVEKALKGYCVKMHDESPPKIHNLEQLADACGLTMTSGERLELRELTTFAEFGRYGDESWLEADASESNTRHWLGRAAHFLSRCT